MKKVIGLITVIFCLMILPVQAAGDLSSEELKDMVMQANRRALALKTYHMTMHSIGSTLIQGKQVNTDVVGDMDVQVNPLVLKNNMIVTVDTDSKIVKQNVEQYIENRGSQLAVYTKADGKWIRQILPEGSYNPVKESEEYIKAIKSVTVKNEDEDSITLDVTADGSYLKDSLHRTISMMGLKNVTLSESAFQEIDDFVYFMTIDKKSGMIAKMDIDLSALMKKMATSLVDTINMPEDQKGVMKEIFSSMKNHVSLTFSRFDEVKPFSVPKDIYR